MKQNKFKDFWKNNFQKDVGIPDAGPAPISLLARQDLEGDSDSAGAHDVDKSIFEKRDILTTTKYKGYEIDEVDEQDEPYYVGDGPFGNIDEWFKTLARAKSYINDAEEYDEANKALKKNTKAAKLLGVGNTIFFNGEETRITDIMGIPEADSLQVEFQNGKRWIFSSSDLVDVRKSFSKGQFEDDVNDVVSGNLDRAWQRNSRDSSLGFSEMHFYWNAVMREAKKRGYKEDKKTKKDISPWGQASNAGQIVKESEDSKYDVDPTTSNINDMENKAATDDYNLTQDFAMLGDLGEPKGKESGKVGKSSNFNYKGHNVEFEGYDLDDDGVPQVEDLFIDGKKITDRNLISGSSMDRMSAIRRYIDTMKKSSSEIAAELEKCQDAFFAAPSYEKSVKITLSNRIDELSALYAEALKIEKNDKAKSEVEAVQFLKTMKKTTFKDALKKTFTESGRIKLRDQAMDLIQDGDFQWRNKVYRFLQGKGATEREIDMILTSIEESPLFER